MTGAEVTVVPSTYPAAPATIHPTTSPTMMLAFFKNGEPNSSVMMMVTKERKPSPMNSAEPHLSDGIRYLCLCTALKKLGVSYGRACLEVIVGHRESGPLVGRAWQPFDPPPQLGMPDEPMREAPIMMMTVPGHTCWKTDYLRPQGVLTCDHWWKYTPQSAWRNE